MNKEKDQTQTKIDPNPNRRKGRKLTIAASLAGALTLAAGVMTVNTLEKGSNEKQYTTTSLGSFDKNENDAMPSSVPKTMNSENVTPVTSEAIKVLPRLAIHKKGSPVVRVPEPVVSPNAMIRYYPNTIIVDPSKTIITKRVNNETTERREPIEAEPGNIKIQSPIVDTVEKEIIFTDDSGSSFSVRFTDLGEAMDLSGEKLEVDSMIDDVNVGQVRGAYNNGVEVGVTKLDVDGNLNNVYETIANVESL